MASNAGAKQLRSFKCDLQDSVNKTDESWCYRVPGLATDQVLNRHGLIKSVSVVSNSKRQCITLHIEDAPSNRVTSADPCSSFILISFADFRLRIPTTPPDTEPATAKESAAYIAQLLEKGLTLNDVPYNFYGHSMSQLKSRSCLLFAARNNVISEKIESLGDFSKIKSVAKKVKRIGLLFSSAEMGLELPAAQCEDIADVRVGDAIFTDGCGQISPHLAHLLVKRVKIVFRNKKYTPSVFQIRYRGYKGVLTYEPSLNGTIHARFRESMKKFSGGPNLNLSVVEYSKPYAYGSLNDEIVLLLHSLGISQDTLLRKQASYLQLLAQADCDPLAAFQFCAMSNRLDLAETVLIDGIEAAQRSVRKLIQKECERMLNKRDEQRCRIMVPESRLLFGVCDPYGILKEGQCFVRITDVGDGAARTLDGAEVLVTRNPCLHPGDLQKFMLKAEPKLAHLVDCIVFPVKGKRPSADLMSGGDLDGDKFFVCWDPDIVPAKVSEPAEYPAGKEKVAFRPVTTHDRLVYFANYNNASLGRVKNLYLDWAKIGGPLSAECQELNRLFSNSVDGNRIKIPAHLEDPPKPVVHAAPPILDVLHSAASATIRVLLDQLGKQEAYSLDALNLLLSRDEIPVSEFELVQIALRWCRQNGAPFTDFLPFFDFDILSDEEKLWLLNQIPPSEDTPSMILNGLLKSDLVDQTELARFRLDHHSLHWKKIFSSTSNRLETLLSSISQALELFHKKLIILRIDDRFSLAIFVPQKLQKRQECKVDDSVRVFALPRSQGTSSCRYRVVPTKINFRLYCDESSFQLYETKRANTFVFLTHGPVDDATYRSMNDRGDRRRQRQHTFDEKINSACRASVALNKISQDVQRHVGRVNRTGILAAEVYVISNRDVGSLRAVDLWRRHIDTQERLPLFDSTPREYTIPSTTEVKWNKKMLTLHIIKAMQWMLHHNELQRLRQVLEHILKVEFSATMKQDLLRSLGSFVTSAPFLIGPLINSDFWTGDCSSVNDIDSLYFAMLQSLILVLNTMAEMALEPIELVLGRLTSISILRFVEIVRLVSLSVHSPELAMDVLLDHLQRESARLLMQSSTILSSLTKSTIGIALDHIDETLSSQSFKDAEPLSLKFNDEINGSPSVKARVRIDSSLARAFKKDDHVRFAAATAPKNAPVARKFSFDALVASSEQGQVVLQCFQPPPTYLEDCSWILQKCVSFVTTNTMFDAVSTFYGGEDEECPLFPALMGLDAPTEELPVQTGEQSCGFAQLNDSQKRAVQAAESAQLCLVWGPPGTGKTQTVAAMLWRSLASEPNKKILVSAPTHNAVDNLLRKFLSGIEQGSKRPNLLRVTTNLQRVAQDLRDYTCDAMFGVDLSEHVAERRKAQKRVKDSQLIFTTCIGAGIGLLRDAKFDTVFIDEASQQTEPTSLVPLVKGASRAVLVGDHVQLRATVQLHAVTQDFDVSLFERLYRASDRAGVRKVLLDTQYRMHRDISSFSSAEFYDSEIKTAVQDADRPLGVTAFPWPSGADGDVRRKVFVQCDSPEDIGRKSKSNKGQAELCRDVCRLLRCSPDQKQGKGQGESAAPCSIAILSPYARQVELLRQLVPDAEVASVDGFQGREADIIVFSTVRCNAHSERGFLNDLRRLNVAVTRPRSGLVDIGDRATLTGGEEPESAATWARLLLSCVAVDAAALKEAV